MSKTETKAAQAVDETVTISKAQFDELLADMALFKQKYAEQQERLKSADETRREREEEESRLIEEANRRAEELVDYHVELGSLRGNQNVEVGINGVQYIIPRGETVRIPRKVVEVLENARAQRAVAYGLQDKRKKEFEESVRALSN